MSLPDIVVNGDTVTIPSMPGAAGHKFFTEVIMDGGLPLWAPIGMLFKSHTGNTDGDITVRNNTFMETPLNMMSRLHDILFYGLTSKNTTVICAEPGKGAVGELRFDSMPLYEFGRPNDRVPSLYLDPYFAFAMEKVSIHFYTEMRTGYRTMADNVIAIRESNLDHAVKGIYLPLASNHTLNNYLRVWAVPVNGAIKVQYLSGMTAAIFNQIWKEAQMYGSGV